MYIFMIKKCVYKGYNLQASKVKYYVHNIFTTYLQQILFGKVLLNSNLKSLLKLLFCLQIMT